MQNLHITHHCIHTSYNSKVLYLTGVGEMGDAVGPGLVAVERLPAAGLCAPVGAVAAAGLAAAPYLGLGFWR